MKYTQQNLRFVIIKQSTADLRVLQYIYDREGRRWQLTAMMIKQRDNKRAGGR